MQTVLIGSAQYEAYASLAEADEYLVAALHAGTTWSGASELTQGQALVTATRILDRQRWISDYEEQADREDVQQIIDACIEMALALIEGSDFQSEQNTSQKLQSIRAGSVSMSYFRGADGTPHRFPQIVHELLRDFLTGADAVMGGVATGIDGVSSTGNDFGHTEGI